MRFWCTPLWTWPTISLGKDWITEVQFPSSRVFALLWIELRLLETPLLKPQVLRQLDLEIMFVRRWLRVDGVIRVGLWSQRISDFLRVAAIRLLPLPGTRHTGHPSRSLDKSPHPKPSFPGPLILNSGLQDGDEHKLLLHCAQTVAFCQQPKQTNICSVWMFPIAKLFPKMYQPLLHQQRRSLSDIWASPEHLPSPPGSAGGQRLLVLEFQTQASYAGICCTANGNFSWTECEACLGGCASSLLCSSNSSQLSCLKGNERFLWCIVLTSFNFFSFLFFVSFWIRNCCVP